MSSDVKPIPDGFRTLTPHLVVRNAAKAIEFYREAFGAEVRTINYGPGKSILHADLKIGDSILLLCDEFPEWGVSPRRRRVVDRAPPSTSISRT